MKLKKMLFQKSSNPDENGSLANHMILNHRVSHRQACKMIGLPRSTEQYKTRAKDDEEVIKAIEKIIEKHPPVGFWQCHYRLRLQGYRWNH